RRATALPPLTPLTPPPSPPRPHAPERLGAPDDPLNPPPAVIPPDHPAPADIHYRLARLLQRQGRRDEARREVLKSLEEAPRFLDAHKLLLELVESPRGTTAHP